MIKSLDGMAWLSAKGQKASKQTKAKLSGVFFLSEGGKCLNMLSELEERFVVEV